MAGLADIVVEAQTLAAHLPSQVFDIVKRRATEAVTRMRGPSHFVPYYGRGTADAGRPELQIRSGAHQAGLAWYFSHVSSTEVVVTFRGNIATQELGATIRPRTAQKLAFPVGEMLTSQGVRRFTGVREAREKGGYETYALPTVIKGRLKATKGPWSVLFLRRESVTIPARPVIGPEVEVAADAIAADLQALLAGAP